MNNSIEQQKKSYKKGQYYKNGQRQNTDEDLSLLLGKVPPQALDLERAVLGAALLDYSCFNIISEILKPECFYLEAHRIVFEAFIELVNKGKPVDIFTVTDHILSKGIPADTVESWPYFVTTLTREVVSIANVEPHAEIVRQKYMLRQLIRISGETLTKAFTNSSPFDLIDEHEREISSIANSGSNLGFYNTASLAIKTIERVDKLRANKEMITGAPTGFPTLDKITNGWQDTDLIILAARPSVGKTALALNLAKNAANSPIKKVPVGFFSLEMSAGQLSQRLISSLGKIDMYKLSNGKLNDADYNHFISIAEDFAQLSIFIDDTAALNLFQLRSKARKMVNKDKVGLIIIDYLQLMSGDTKSFNREQEISTISRGLKALAKELNVPIIALSQMSRSIEGTKREPQLSDLRESGAIEQDADMVMFASRDDYQQDINSVDPMLIGGAKIKIAKHRNGALDTLAFNTDLSIQTWFEPDEYRQHTSGRFNVRPIIRPVSENTIAQQQAMRNENNDSTDDLPF